MARINQSDVIQKAVHDLAISTSTDKIPTETLDKVQLTYDLNKKFSNFVVRGFQGTTGTFTISPPFLSAREEIYLTSISLGMAKDATCDAATGTILASITPDSSGIPNGILGISMITLTADSQTAVLSLAYPIKLKFNTTISVTGTYTLGLMNRTCSVTGFTTSSN